MPASDSNPAPAISVENPGPATLHLRLLATSDLHAHVMAWDYYADQPSENCGLARTAALIRAARAEAANCLLLDNGDFLNGNPLGDFVAERYAQGVWQGHPMIAAMNLLAYDAATLGNHDFSAGINLLTASLKAANFPVVSANIQPAPADSGSDTIHIAPHALLDRQFLDDAGRIQRLRIGVIGFLPPQTLIWEARHLKSHFTTTDILATARNLVPRLRLLGADLVIALSHSGLGGAGEAGGAEVGGGEVGGGENVSLALAAVEGIDAVIAGHTHLVFPPSGTPFGTPSGPPSGNPSGTPSQRLASPIVMPGFFGSHLGVIDLNLVRLGAGWRVLGHQVQTRPIASRNAETGQLAALVASEPAIEAAARPCHEALRHRAQVKIGQTGVPLHSFFALIQPSAALHLVADAQTAFVRAALADTPHAALPVLAAVAPFKAGGRGGAENYTDVPAGPLTARHAADLYIHPNSTVALRLSGRQIALWLERAASLYHQIAPGAQDAALIDLDFPAFNFDLIYGLTYRIDLAAPRRFDAKGLVRDPLAARITDLCYRGSPLDPDATFALATNSYRSSGGSGFAATTPEHVIYEASQTTRAVLQRHLGTLPSPTLPATDSPPPTLPPPNLPPPALPNLASWALCPMPGTTVLFDSSPRAAPHLAELRNLRIEPLALQPSGFQRFRLHL